jgi:hypothetical protein
MITPIFICTHGRPDKQYTYQTLRNSGYTGKICFVVDDEDDTVDELRKNYPNEDVLQFNKQELIDASDTGTNEDHRACILYAKHFCECVADNMCLQAFIIADDDILKFRYRYVEDGKLKSLDVKNMDKVISIYTDMMLKCDMSATGFGFTQFYFTGIHSFDSDNMQKYRVPYNFVFRNTKHKINWMSWFGEDIITAVYYGRCGSYMSALPYVQQEIVPLATADGGMKDTYDSNSDVRLAMQNIMYLPTELKVYKYKNKYMASIKRDNAFPKIVSSNVSKSRCKC